MRNKVLVVLSAFIIILLVFSVVRGAQKNARPTGIVRIKTGNDVYKPVENWIYGKDDKFADGFRIQVKDIVGSLVEIPLDNTFKIEINGKRMGESYTIFNGKFEEIYRGSKLKIPTEHGKYFVCLEIKWGNESRYEGYQYFFMFSIE